MQRIEHYEIAACSTDVTRHWPGEFSSPGLHRRKRRNHERRRPPRRSKPSSVVATGTAAVMKSDPRAASRACCRIRSASRSACPGDERAASRPKTAARTRLITEQNESGRNGLEMQPQALPPGDLSERQDGQREDEGGRTKRRSPALALNHGAQPQNLRIECKLKKINASHDAAPNGRRQSQFGKQSTG